jgi:hypothetical protein
MKKPRRNILLIGSVYAVALIVLLLAVAAFTGILPLGIRPAATVVAKAAPTVVDKALPALRPIWPAGNETRSPTRTRTPTASPIPTQVPVTSTWTPAPEPIALAPEATVATALPVPPGARQAATGGPPAPGGLPAPGMPSPVPGMPTVDPAPQAGQTPAAVQPTTSPVPGAPTLGPEFGPTNVPNAAQTSPSAPPRPSATLVATQARPTATNTATDTATATPQGKGRIVGKVLIDDALPTSMLTLTLESQTYEVITHTSVMIGTGAYTFTKVLDSGEGYNVVFAQEKNPGVQIDEVTTWAWIGPVPIEGDAVVTMPDFDIGLRGLMPVNPVPDMAYDQPNPSSLQFTWTSYPGTNVEYWMDLYQGKEQRLVKQSARSPESAYTWDGKIDGQRVADEYWWGVGARTTLDTYLQVAYTYLTRFVVRP